MHKNNERGLCKHGSLDNLPLSYEPLLGKRGIKIKSKIYSQESIYLYVTDSNGPWLENETFKDPGLHRQFLFFNAQIILLK
jgi:hypothetical protein